MEGHRAITLKTQVRRLRYFQVMCNSLRKTGTPLEALQRTTTDWAVHHGGDIVAYVSPSGEIRPSSPEKPSQSFRYYFAAMLRLGLAHELSALVTNSRMGAVLKHLPKPGQPRASNSFSLAPSEKAFFLFILVEHDADYLFTVLGQVAKKKDCTLDRCLVDFQDDYLDRLNQRLAHTRIDRTLGEIQDARQRVMEWRSPKRYSEDIVPTRLNWLIDLGLISIDKSGGRFPNYSLSSTGLALVRLWNTGENTIDIPDGWTSNGFIATCAALLGGKTESWSELNAEKQVRLFSECLAVCQKHFGSSLLPRIPADQMFVYTTIHLLCVHSVRAEIATLESWVGYDRALEGLQVGYRKSARLDESYLVVKHA